MVNSKINIEQVVKTLKSLFPVKDQVNLHEPCFMGAEWKYVKECIDTNWVSSVGKFVDQFEKQLEEFTGVRRAIAVVNGTSALHICLKLAGVKAGDEVIIPSLSFVATANAVAYCGAIPHFVDSEEKTLGMDPGKLEAYLHDIVEIKGNKCFNKLTKRPIKAIMPMHTFGHPVDLDSLLDVCIRFNLELIEDAAESLGSYYKGKHTGNCGRLSALSFNGNKIITTGGGGAILTNDEALGKLAKHITTTAKVPHKWAFDHDQIGYNYRLPNINAALGCAQLEQLPLYIDQKRRLAERYQEAFADAQGFRIFQEPEFATSNYWLNLILLNEENREQRDEILEATNSNGIMTRPAWTLLHKLEMYKDCPRMDLACAVSLEERIVNIPSSSFLGGA